MTARTRNRKAVAWVVWMAACAAGVAVALIYPRPVSHPVLGGDWKCSRMALLTSCSHSDRSAPVGNLRAAPVAFRQA
jgi:hypothetical protein